MRLPFGFRHGIHSPIYNHAPAHTLSNKHNDTLNPTQSQKNTLTRVVKYIKNVNLNVGQTLSKTKVNKNCIKSKKVNNYSL